MSAPSRVDRAFRLVKRLRNKYKLHEEQYSSCSETLDRIMWHSLPFVWPSEEWTDASRGFQAQKRRKSRVYAHLRAMSETQHNLYFATLTFRDDVLESTSSSTRRKYVSLWMGQNARDYVANVDYGAKNGREHYHAVFAFNGQIEALEWPYGFYRFTLTPVSAASESKDVAKLSSYLTKRLANHAGKETSGSIMYKRGLRDMDELPF